MASILQVRGLFKEFEIGYYKEIILEDEVTKVFLSTRGFLDDVDEVKHDPRLEVEWMTLLEREREKFEEGIEKGIQQGLEQGLEQGKEKGRLEERKAFVKNLLELGVDIEMIMKASHLSREEIEKLQKEV